MSYRAGRDLNEAQFRRLAKLAKNTPSCRVVGYRYWDASQQNIVPIIEYPSGIRAELMPYGRLNNLPSREGLRHDEMPHDDVSL